MVITVSSLLYGTIAKSVKFLRNTFRQLICQKIDNISTIAKKIEIYILSSEIIQISEI